MSRSNPSEITPNPAERWFEWDGAKGVVRYYDKQKGERVEVGPKFRFILLDQLSSVRGWHEPTKSGIFSNEVRSTVTDAMLVKTFGNKTLGTPVQTLAHGLYTEIKDRVKAAGGHFTATCYCAWKDGEGLRIGAIQWKGAALRAWSEFSNANRKVVWEKAVGIVGSVEGKKGKVVFRTPAFKILDLTPEMDAAAKELDKKLQDYLSTYFKRSVPVPAQQPATDEAAQPDAPTEAQQDAPPEDPLAEDQPY
jgi:hypothetical protein